MSDLGRGATLANTIFLQALGSALSRTSCGYRYAAGGFSDLVKHVYSYSASFHGSRALLPPWNKSLLLGYSMIFPFT